MCSEVAPCYFINIPHSSCTPEWNLIPNWLKLTPISLHLEAGLIWWYDFFNQQIHGMTWPTLVELGAPKMEGQFMASRPMSHFNLKKKLIEYDFFSELYPLDYVEI